MAKWLINPEMFNRYERINLKNEKDRNKLNLEIAYEIKKLLERNGESVLLTRSTNTYVEDKEKISIIDKWKADFFITLNINEKKEKEFKSTEIYINNIDKNEKDLANFIKSELVSNLRTEDKGIKKINDVLLEESKIPSIIINGKYEETSNIEEISKKYGELISKGCLTMVNKVLIDIPQKKAKTPKREGWRICLGYYKDYEEAEVDIIKFKKMNLKEIYIVPYPEKEK